MNFNPEEENSYHTILDYIDGLNYPNMITRCSVNGKTSTFKVKKY